MYNRTNKTTNMVTSDKKTPVYFDMAVNVAMVTNVRKINDSCIGFTLKCKGFSFYGLRAVEWKNDKGQGWFISIPATKGKDGKYYNNYGLYLSDEDQESIIDTVFNILEG